VKTIKEDQMKNHATVAVALLAGALFTFSGCTMRLSGSATTSVKGKSKASGKPVHEGKPVEGDPDHPTVHAKPVDEGKPVHEGKPVAEASGEVHVALPVVELTSGVQEAQQTCPNTTEVTNGIDDDCDGQIDENLVGSGPLQITLWWNSPADLDLRVVDPTNTEINYKNKKSPSGGYMDKDSRSSCKGNQTIENVYWSDKPPKGTYSINVKYYSYCKDKSKPTTTANVTVSYKGQILGPYTVDLDQGDKVEILQFSLEE
jgi:hypothetical protein